MVISLNQAIVYLRLAGVIGLLVSIAFYAIVQALGRQAKRNSLNACEELFASGLQNIAIARLIEGMNDPPSLASGVLDGVSERMLRDCELRLSKLRDFSEGYDDLWFVLLEELQGSLDLHRSVIHGHNMAGVLHEPNRKRFLEAKFLFLHARDGLLRVNRTQSKL